VSGLGAAWFASIILRWGFLYRICDWGEMMGAKENDDSGQQKGSPKARSSGVGKRKRKRPMRCIECLATKCNPMAKATSSKSSPTSQWCWQENIRWLKAYLAAWCMPLGISRSRMREMVVWPSPNLVCLSSCLLRTSRNPVVSSLVQSLATRSTTKVEYTSQVLPKVSGLWIPRRTLEFSSSS